MTLDADTIATTALVADPTSPVGRDAPAAFLAACKADADAHGGLVSVNRTRALLVDAQIPPRRLSAFWSHFTGEGQPMRKVRGLEPDDGTTTRNGNHLHAKRKWVGP